MMMDIGGSDELEWEERQVHGRRQACQRLAAQLLRRTLIEGGTSEVQLNIIAKRILELPDA
ncbi:MAG: hypothetical protein R3C54_03105 [Parvularculaceae bacterium]